MAAAALPLNEDPLDRDAFDPIEFINILFPNEQSFSQADLILNKFRVRIKKIDKEVRDMLREQTDGELDGGRKELEIAKEALSKLKQDIHDIREKARHAEQTVLDITKDIKSLDCAKKNLTTSITVLKRLQMLASAVDQLQTIQPKRQYAEMAKLIPAITSLATQFHTYKNIKQINDLLDRIVTLHSEIKRLVFSDFEGSFSTVGSFTGNVQQLQDACLVVDTLPEEVKRQLLDWYCDLQLREYRSIFRPTDEIGNLENLTRRYTRLQKICKTYDEEQAQIFPKHWHVSERVCERFCSITKDDVFLLLSKAQNIDVKLLINNLTETIKFEASLNRRFTPADKNAKSEFQFSGKISSSFEPFMKVYLEVEDKACGSIVDKFKTTNAYAEDESVFAASLDLFVLYRQTLKSMAELNTRKPFLDLSKIFGKWLTSFCEVLTTKIPKEEKRASTPDEIKLCCFVLNTADYCHSTTQQLEDKLKEKSDAEFKNQMDLSKERELFLMCCTTAIQALVRQLNSCVYNALQAMTKIPWATMQTVGDQSEYVNIIASSFNTNVKIIRKIVRNQKHFKWFCDKFADSFVPWFVRNIYACKPVSEAAAEQLLLDSLAIKTLLLEIPNIGADERAPPSAAFTRFVVKGMSKAETLLKVVLTPLDPPDAIIKNYLILCVEGQDDEEKKEAMTVQKLTELRDGLVKILDLKGVKKQDQQPLIDILMQRISSTRGAAVPSLLASLTATSPPPAPPAPNATFQSFTSGLASMNQATSQSVRSSVNDASARLTGITEGFKKFTTMSSFNFGNEKKK